MTAKAIVDQISGMATMIAFAFPEGGPIAAAVVSTATGVFNLLVPDATVPSAAQALTKQDLSNAIADLKANIADSLFDQDVDNASNWVTNFNHELLANITIANGLGLDKETIFFALDPTTKTHRDDLTAYFDTNFQSNLVTLKTKTNVLTRSRLEDVNLSPLLLAEHRTQTTGLYCLAGSARVLYAKMALTWDWVNEIMYCTSYPKFIAAEKAWNQKSQAYRNLHPDEDPKSLFPGFTTNPGPLKSWQDWLKPPHQGGANNAQELIDAVEEQTRYSIHDPTTKQDGLYKRMVASWQDRHDVMVSLINGFPKVYNPAIIKLIWERIAEQNNFGPTPQPASKFSDLAEIWNEISLGVEVLQRRAEMTRKAALANVSYSDLVLYHDSLVAWQDGLESIQFTTIDALDNDTPKTIAARVYKDSKLFTKLKDSTGKPFKNGDLNLAGQRVVAPDLNFKRTAVPPLPTATF